MMNELNVGLVDIDSHNFPNLVLYIANHSLFRICDQLL